MPLTYDEWKLSPNRNLFAFTARMSLSPAFLVLSLLRLPTGSVSRLRWLGTAFAGFFAFRGVGHGVVVVRVGRAILSRFESFPRRLRSRMFFALCTGFIVNGSNPV